MNINLNNNCRSNNNDDNDINDNDYNVNNDNHKNHQQNSQNTVQQKINKTFKEPPPDTSAKVINEC